MSILTSTDRKQKTAVVNRGCRGVQNEGVRILMSGQKRGIPRAWKALIHRRSAIEPSIGHMKMDVRLARNPLKGAVANALHAVMCGAGHNLRVTLAKLRFFLPPEGIALSTLLACLSSVVASHLVVLGRKMGLFKAD